jgi:hypothetical protein
VLCDQNGLTAIQRNAIDAAIPFATAHDSAIAGEDQPPDVKRAPIIRRFMFHQEDALAIDANASGDASTRRSCLLPLLTVNDSSAAGYEVRSSFKLQCCYIIENGRHNVGLVPQRAV